MLSTIFLILPCFPPIIRFHTSCSCLLEILTSPPRDDESPPQSAVGLPVMCSDVVVYPYQIYQARLAGADAIKLVAPALPAKVSLACSRFRTCAAAVAGMGCRCGTMHCSSAWNSFSRPIKCSAAIKDAPLLATGTTLRRTYCCAAHVKARYRCAVRPHLIVYRKTRMRSCTRLHGSCSLQ